MKRLSAGPMGSEESVMRGESVMITLKAPGSVYELKTFAHVEGQL